MTHATMTSSPTSPSSSKQLDLGRDDDPPPRLREEPAAALISACGGCFDDPAVSEGDDTAERMAVDEQWRPPTPARRRCVTTPPPDAADEFAPRSSSVGQTVRRRSATARTTADRAPRVRRPAAAWHPDRRYRLELPAGCVTSVPVRSPEVTSEALGRPRCRQNGGDSWRSSSSVARSGKWSSGEQRLSTCPAEESPTDQDGCIDGVGRLATLLTLPLTSFA